jgi:hypothetical protein
MEGIVHVLMAARATITTGRAIRPARPGREANEAVRDLRRQFARGEIDASRYERGVLLLGFEHLDS